MEIEAGKFEVVKDLDYSAELEAQNAEILKSEENYLAAIIKNGEDEADNTQTFWDGVAKFSKSAATTAKTLRDERRKEKETEFAFRILTEGVSEEVQEHFRNGKELLFEESNELDKMASIYQKETGDGVTAREFLNMSKWEKYAFAEQWALAQAKEYPNYFYNAYDTAYIDTPSGRKYNKDISNPSEQAALDAEIKHQFSERFAGLNEGMIATIIKPEIDKHDDLRRQIQTKEQEIAFQQKEEKLSIDQLKNTLVRANPQDSINVEDEWTRRYAARNGITVQDARLKFKSNLVALVSDPKSGVTYADAMGIIGFQHESSRGGGKRTLLDYKEYTDLPELLGDAFIVAKQAKETDTKNEITKDVALILNMGDRSEEQKILLREGLKRKYKDLTGVAMIPADVQAALKGHLPDDVAKDMLKSLEYSQGGMIYDYQLQNVSPAIYNEYESEGKIVFGGGLRNSDGIDESTAKEIIALTNRATNSTLGNDDAKTIPWLTMQSNLSAEFVRVYNQVIKGDGKTMGSHPQAYQAAMTHINQKIGDPEWVTAASVPDWQKELSDAERDAANDKNETYGRYLTNGMNQSSGGKWKTNKIVLDKDSYSELTEWANSPQPRLSGMPTIYRDIARRTGIMNPVEFGLTQAGLLSGEPPKTIPESTLLKNENVIRLLTGLNTNTRNIQAYVILNNLDTDSAVTSIYNKKGFLNQDI